MKMRWTVRTATFAALALTVIGLAACGQQNATGSAVQVVTSTTVLADITRNVAGRSAQVRSIMGIGVDPHTFEPSPSDLETVAKADLVVVNGAGLEGTLDKAIRQAGVDARIVVASKGLTSRNVGPQEPGTGKGSDPHFWLNPIMTVSYARAISAALQKTDPSHATAYRRRADVYIAKLRRLDAWIKRQVSSVPPARRVLVMNHASHGYWADRYGFRVVGTILPGTSTDSSPTPKELANLLESIKRERVPAIFVETEDNPQLARQLAEDAHVKVVTTLRDHSLGPPGSGSATYLQMMRQNTRTIVGALR